jgi:hypothetical protein
MDKQSLRFSRRDLRVTIDSVVGRAAMRWYVSIGAVLVAGWLAGGDVAGIAAPGPGKPITSVVGRHELWQLPVCSVSGVKRDI